MWTLFLSIALFGLAFGSNSSEHSTTATPSTTISPTTGQIPLVFHHKNLSQKRHRRQYSEKAPPYEIRFLPYPAPATLRQIRAQDGLYGGNGLESSTPSSTAVSTTSTEAQLTYPPPTLLTTMQPSSPGAIPTYGSRPTISFNANHLSAYMQPPNGAPRYDYGKVESSPNNSQYYYPPRMPLPLSQCFYNPTGYACCNAQLNDLMVETYSELEAKPTFHTCNINMIATLLQTRAEKRFNTTFETVAGFEDFAQKVHFNGDLICKIELGGKYMLAYGTPKSGDHSGPNGSNYNKYSGDTLKRQRRNLYGPENEMIESDVSHTMWV